MHFKNPILALKFDARVIVFYFSKFMMLKVHKLNFTIETDYIEPDYCDLYNIYKIIRNNKPKVSVEIGPGYSTYVILKALKQNFDETGILPKLYCLEQDQFYLDLHKKYLEKNLDKEIINLSKFIFTDLKLVNYEGTTVSACTNFPNDQINFIYEDRTDHEKYPIAGDAILIEKNMPNDYTICVDGMLATADFYKKNLKRKYKYSGGFIYGSTWVPINDQK